MQRFGIILMFALLVVLAGGLLSIPLLVRDPLPILSAQSPIVVEREQGVLPTVARIQLGADGRFVMHFVLLAGDEGDLPQVVLRMPDHEMAPMEPAVERLDRNRYRATGAVAAPGRWEASIGTDDGRAEVFQFIVRDF